MSFGSVSIVGLGYIGLPLAIHAAQNGYLVHGYDINASVVSKLQRGEPHISEGGIQNLLEKTLSSGGLQIATTLCVADIYVIAVPTPLVIERKEADLSFLLTAVQTVSKILKAGDTLIIESTCPVGSTETIRDYLVELRPDLSAPGKNVTAPDYHIAYCPERVIPGNIFNELSRNDRIVGGISDKCTSKAIAFYEKLTNGSCYPTSTRVAEMTKLTENSFRDVNIAFANELSLICDELEIDVSELLKLANCHPRVNILQPGIGVGGHCIAVDPWFIVSKTPEIAKIVKNARGINDNKPKWVAEKILEQINLEMRNRNSGETLCIAFYGISYKPDVDDLRESPAIKIIDDVTKSYEAKYLMVEPNLDKLPPMLSEYELVNSQEAALKADICIALVNHTAFRGIFDKSQKVIDFCGLSQSN